MKRIRLRTKAEIILFTFILMTLTVFSVASVTRTISDTGDNIETFIKNSKGNYWGATGDNIQNAINDLGGYGTIWLAGDRTYTLTDSIMLSDKSNIAIVGYGATLKIANNFYSSSGNLNFIDIDDSSDITLEGFNIDANGNNQGSYDIVSIRVRGTSDRIYLKDLLLTDSREGDLYVTGNVGTVNVLNCRFYNFGGGTTPYSIYMSGGENLNLVQCHWDTYNPSSTAQCMYLSSSNGNYIVDSCTFKDVYIAVDIRYGFATITNCVANDLNLAISTSIGDPFVVVDNSKFINCEGTPGVLTAGIHISTGTLHIKDSYLTAKSGYSADSGIKLRYKNSNKETRNSIIEGCQIKGFSDHCVFLDGTLGNHVIRNNIFEDSTDGIESGDNTYNSVAYENTFVNIDNEFDDNDDKLIIKGVNIDDYVYPLFEPTTSIAGSAWFDPTTDTLWIYNGNSWVSTTLS